MPKPGQRAPDGPALRLPLFLARMLCRLAYIVWPGPWLMVGERYVIDGIEYERAEVRYRGSDEALPAIMVGHFGAWARVYEMGEDGRPVLDASRDPITRLLFGPFDVVGLDPVSPPVAVSLPDPLTTRVITAFQIIVVPDRKQIEAHVTFAALNHGEPSEVLKVEGLEAVEAWKVETARQWGFPLR